MRLFIAVDVNEQIKYSLADIVTQLKKCNLHAKWVKPENLHLTLKFLGEVEEKKIAVIENAIKKVSSGFPAFTAALKDLGFFPNERNPRVIFVSTDNEDTLKSIASSLEESLAPAGFEPEHRFKSHLTIARLKSKKNIDCLIRKIKEVKPKGETQVKELTLYKSTLTPSGPIYEKISTFTLQS